MKSLWLLALASAIAPFIAAPTAGAADDPDKPYLQTLEDDPEATFHLFLPPGYGASREFPLLVSLHGAGEKGNRMARYWKNAALRHNMILCCPNAAGESWTRADMLRVINIVEHLLLEYAIDKNKILLNGVSAGGAVAYVLGFTIPVMFPYLNPMSAGFGPGLAKLVPDAERRPLYITHGARDELIPPENGGAKAARLLKANGFDVAYSERPNDGHELPEGEQEKILNWFKEQCARDRVRRSGENSALDY